MDDKRAIEIYKELAEVNSKITVDLTSKLDKVATNLKEMNDTNILHQKQVVSFLKILSSIYFKLIVGLVAVLSLVAIGEKAVDIIMKLLL